MATRWYIEIWAFDGKRATTHTTKSTFVEALEFIKNFRLTPSTDILRVLAPRSASSSEIDDLKGLGFALT